MECFLNFRKVKLMFFYCFGSRPVGVRRIDRSAPRTQNIRPSRCWNGGSIRKLLCISFWGRKYTTATHTHTQLTTIYSNSSTKGHKNAEYSYSTNFILFIFSVLPIFCFPPFFADPRVCASLRSSFRSVLGGYRSSGNDRLFCSLTVQSSRLLCCACIPTRKKSSSSSHGTTSGPLLLVIREMQSDSRP